jgi:hypothetical protein
MTMTTIMPLERAAAMAHKMRVLELAEAGRRKEGASTTTASSGDSI